jgi:Skp family chaperone for outer membrane proteins
MLGLLKWVTTHVDLVVAFGLVIVALMVFVASRIGVLPKKGVGVVIGALLALFGVFVLQRARRRALQRQAKELEDRIKKRDEELAAWRDKYQASMAQYHAAGAKLDQQLAATQTELALTLAENRAEREKIDRMSPDEVFEWLRKQPLRTSTPEGANVP